MHTAMTCRFFNLLNSFGLYNKNAKILFLVSISAGLEVLCSMVEIAGRVEMEGVE